MAPASQLALGSISRSGRVRQLPERLLRGPRAEGAWRDAVAAAMWSNMRCPAWGMRGRARTDGRKRWQRFGCGNVSGLDPLPDLAGAFVNNVPGSGAGPCAAVEFRLVFLCVNDVGRRGLWGMCCSVVLPHDAVLTCVLMLKGLAEAGTRYRL
eukprot:jgi/Ulvmu1/2217/UM013_0063.1